MAKMAHPRNSGSALRIFYRRRKANMYMKNFIVVFGKKIHLGQFDLFRPFFTV